MDDISNTVIFSTISIFFQSFWSEPVGRIFITTAIAYSISYMIYSSYISWFAGGYGGILLGQLGFTASDFLTLFPTSILLIIETIKSSMKSVIAYILFYIALPIIIIIVLLAIRFTGWTNPIHQNSFINFIGLLIFLFGIRLPLSSKEGKKYKPILATSLTYVGAILFALSAPMAITESATPMQQNYSILSKVMNEIISFFVLIIIILSPPLIGLKMASFAVEKRLLSQITNINLNQPIQIDGFLRKNQKNKQENVYIYQSDLLRPVYLIGSFSRITAIYIPPETIGTERGGMHLLSNDIICSIEVEGRKNEEFRETKVVK